MTKMFYSFYISIINVFLFSNIFILKTDILLITPPFTQLNTPYPATVYLKGFLNSKNIPSSQIDLGIDVINHIFSKNGLIDLFAETKVNSLSNNGQRIFALRNEYIKTIDQVISFLQNNNPTLAQLICSETFLPEASRFNAINDINWAFGSMGNQDKAKHLATLYLEDISDFIIENIDPYFGFSRYAERISSSANSFDHLYSEVHKENSHITIIANNLLEIEIKKLSPKLICFTVPFPGNLFAALNSAKFIKENYPDIKIVMGGGYPNTELRSIKDNRFFEFIDFLCLDDGERPIELIYNHVIKNNKELKRTFHLKNDIITYSDNSELNDYAQKDVGIPDYTGLKLNKYISVIEVTNPMHSLWSDGRWNKLTLAHGCYWGKCTFCDISLSYIKDYEPLKAKDICDKIEAIISSTNETGFHFVDEAAPPALMKELALEILRRNITITWWTNIRFEKSFTADLCQLLKKSGCIAVSGGIEVASDRLLKLIDKGIDLEQLTHVTSHFSEAGIMVHSYLMYGFPSQTDLETINSLEVVRQLFEKNLIQSGFWHQFAMTAHSPVGMNPELFKVKNLEVKENIFANNDLPHEDMNGCDHAKYSKGLSTSIYNYMHGNGFDVSLSQWFNFPTKYPTISEQLIDNYLSIEKAFVIKPNTKVIWTEMIPDIELYSVVKKGKKRELAKMEFHTINNTFKIKGTPLEIETIQEILIKTAISSPNRFSFKHIEDFYIEKTSNNIQDFMISTNFETLKENGLLFL